MQTAFTRYLRDVLGVTSFLRSSTDAVKNSMPPETLEKWEAVGSLASGVAWISTRRPSIIEGDLAQVIDRMTAAIKLEPPSVLKIETSAYDIDRALDHFAKRGLTTLIILGDEFESFLPVPLNETKMVMGVRVLRIPHPRYFTIDEKAKREAWTVLKKLIGHL